MKRDRIYIVNGPNLNRLGRRDQQLYGNIAMEGYLADLRIEFPDYDLKYEQSNCEGAIIDALQAVADDERALGVVINPGAYAHYSYAIADALADLKEEGIRAVEVHITNIHAREEFRRNSVTAAACTGCITGLGMQGYLYAINYLLL